MLYLLDANVLIDANRDYYPLERVPEFWEWLVMHACQKQVKVPQEVYDEILAYKGRKNELLRWLKNNRDDLILDESVDRALVDQVNSLGYAPNLTAQEIEKVGQDPFLIAYALSAKNDRTVVTNEVSKPRKESANRHIPDVCNDLKVLHCNTFRLIKDLDFMTRRRK